MIYPILVTRHAQSTFNRDGLVIGQNDPVLTPEGRRAGKALASRLAREFRGIAGGVIYSSPLMRAVNTARIFAECLKWPVAIREALTELSAGKWEGLRRDVLGLSGNNLRQGWEDRPPKGESYADGEKRVLPVAAEILGRRNEGPVLVMAHAALNRVLLRLLKGLSPEEAVTLDIPHDVVHRV